MYRSMPGCDTLVLVTLHFSIISRLPAFDPSQMSNDSGAECSEHCKLRIVPQVEFMRLSGELDKVNHIRKTDQSAYVEARARQHNLMKGAGGAGVKN